MGRQYPDKLVHQVNDQQLGTVIIIKMISQIKFFFSPPFGLLSLSRSAGKPAIHVSMAAGLLGRSRGQQVWRLACKDSSEFLFLSGGSYKEADVWKRLATQACLARFGDRERKRRKD